MLLPTFTYGSGYRFAQCQVFNVPRVTPRYSAASSTDKRRSVSSATVDMRNPQSRAL